MDDKKKFGMMNHLDWLERYISESLDHNVPENMTVEQWHNDKEIQKRNNQIQFKLLCDKILSDKENNPKNNIRKIEELIQELQRSPGFAPYDKDRVHKNAVTSIIIDFFQRLKNLALKAQTSNELKTLNFKEFVYLCFELKLVKEPSDRMIQEREIRQIYEKYENPIFHKIQLRNPITDKTNIISQVRKYNSNDKDIETIKKVKTYIKDLKLKND
jgi:hypothetical protein